VTQDHTRKQFLSKLLGLFAVTGFVSKLTARSANLPAVTPEVPKSAAFALRQEPRAVSRRADSV
jgi:hypothetical protein